MSCGSARYDGYSQCYDELFSEFHPGQEEVAFLQEFLGTATATSALTWHAGPAYALARSWQPGTGPWG